METVSTHKFRNRILHGGGLLIDDVIEIHQDVVEMKRKRLFPLERYSITIPKCNIVSVTVLKTLAGAVITVISHSSNCFISSGYSYTTACRIKDLITAGQ